MRRIQSAASDFKTRYIIRAEEEGAPGPVYFKTQDGAKQSKGKPVIDDVYVTTVAEATHFADDDAAIRMMTVVNQFGQFASQEDVTLSVEPTNAV